MIILWLVAGASLLVSLLAIRQVRRVTRRHDELSQLYWELRYQHGELRARIDAGAAESPIPRQTPGGRANADAFVPLSAVKR